MTKYIIQGKYGNQYGFEDLTEENTREEAEKRLSEYNENEPQYSHRILEVKA
jgi:hypothetical protein